MEYIGIYFTLKLSDYMKPAAIPLELFFLYLRTYFIFLSMTIGIENFLLKLNLKKKV